MAQLQGAGQPVSSTQLALARRAWTAFCEPEPIAWEALLRADTTSLPFLEGAVLRHLEQYPSPQNGLNRTEAQALDAIKAGVRKRWRIFEAAQASEERRFMGDTTFWLYLDRMIGSRPALLEQAGDRITLTSTGEQVMRNELDWSEIGGIDRWLGGVHLTSRSLWRWDRMQNKLIVPGAMR
jgi:hypothetical protein